MEIVNFTPWSATLGGVLIGVASAMLLLLNGRIAGVAGILSRLLPPHAGDAAWRVWFLGGLVAGGVVWRLFSGQTSADIEIGRAHV